MSRRTAGPFIVLATFTALAVSPSPAWSWGGDGHRTVGAIADLILQGPDFAKTREQVNQLLEGTSLSDVAVWMDCAKGFSCCHSNLTDEEKAYVASNHDHHAYHYTDVPIQQTEYQFGTAGTKTDDAVQIIRYAVSVLRGNPPNDGPAKLTGKQAVWVLGPPGG
ncbi:MAG TPA: S1/P1 nuclease [Xanthobacteraceae bacterium]|nr:S1/P1 nuclease [Xanthobacteraceae bacterium]